MATSNRRVAAYLPDEVDEVFKQYKIDNGFTRDDEPTSNDSKALISILSQFLGVEHQVAHSVSLPDNLVTEDMLQEWQNEVDGRFSSLLSKLEWLTNKVEKDDVSSVPAEPSDQLVMDVGQAESTTPTDTEEFMSGEALSVRLGLSKSGVKNAKNRYKGDHQKFFSWSQERDPNGVGWQYSEEDRKYYPVKPTAKTVS